MPSVDNIRFVGYIGAAANWLIPIATINNVLTQKPESIDPVMTTILAVYSSIFMRWALAIAPANYPLAACHVTNFSAQLTLLAKKYVMPTSAAAAAPEGKQVEKK
jgi:hypothetical protein